MQLETERLLLTPVSTEYTEEVYTHFRGPVVTYMQAGAAQSIEETRAVLCEMIQGRESGEEFVFSILLKRGGGFLGLAGLHELKREVPELGLWLKASAHGHHYGREAIGGLMEYARSLGIARLCYPVDRRNIASRKIPLFYGGRRVVECKTVRTADGRVLEEEVYEIDLR